MSELVQMRKKAQITLPQSVRKKLNIEEGDFLDVQVRGSEVVLKVKKLVDKDQAWFWTKRWQEGEREAEEDIKAGRGVTFPDMESAIKFLEAEAREYDAKKTAPAVREKTDVAYSPRRSGKKSRSASLVSKQSKTKSTQD